MDTPAQRPTFAQVVLGLFISWQLLFLPAANYLAFFPHGQPEDGELSDSRSAPNQSQDDSPVQTGINVAAGITDAWAYLTGQVQAWWLFAPDVPRAATFPIVELRWDDSPPVRMRTILEPNNLQHYFRPPSSFDRLFHYEVRLGLIVSNWNEQTLADAPEFWRTAFQDRVRRQWRSIRAYLRWYVQSFEREHPEQPSPREAILFIRIYRIPECGQKSAVAAEPLEEPLARWRPYESARPGELPVEAFDPVAKAFVPLKTKD